jgi:hypothetical protein
MAQRFPDRQELSAGHLPDHVADDRAQELLRPRHAEAGGLLNDEARLGDL